MVQLAAGLCETYRNCGLWHCGWLLVTQPLIPEMGSIDSTNIRGIPFPRICRTSRNITWHHVTSQVNSYCFMFRLVFAHLCNKRTSQQGSHNIGLHLAGFAREMSFPLLRMYQDVSVRYPTCKKGKQKALFITQFGQRYTQPNSHNDVSILDGPPALLPGDVSKIIRSVGASGGKCDRGLEPREKRSRSPLPASRHGKKQSWSLIETYIEAKKCAHVHFYTVASTWHGKERTFLVAPRQYVLLLSFHVWSCHAWSHHLWHCGTPVFIRLGLPGLTAPSWLGKVGLFPATFLTWQQRLKAVEIPVARKL